ncbi:MAG: hypothetical protein BEU05_00415 [Marine Group III euryarchaeote CG-Bathy2]|nr:MAG: hypothetical protein BEU05_00415 [Marine Group III euryarchaeote CG-Bathy2]
MLNPARRTETIYFLDEVLQESDLGEKEVEPFIATLVALATRETLGAAADLLEEKTGEGIITPDMSERLLRIMSRFSVMR